MSNKLIFFRHGKAERPDGYISDWERSLTDKGKEATKTVIPKLHMLLGEDSKPMIWASPKLRAKQTAEILAEGLDVKSVRYLPEIAHGDDGIFAEIESLDETFTVFIVGHEPFLSMWVEDLTGASTFLKTSAGICVEVDDVREQKGRLAWMVEKSPLKIKFGESAQEQAQSIFIYYLQEVWEAFFRFFNDPADPETCHKFRVKIRQFRGLLSFFRPLMKGRKSKELEAQISGAAKQFNELRDLDVLMGIWEEMGEDKEGKSLLSVAMKENRMRLQNSLTSESSREDIKSRISVFDILLSRELWGKGIAYLSLEGFTAMRFRKWEEEIEEKGKNIDWRDFKQVHHMRIRLKKMRYGTAVLLPEGSERGKGFREWAAMQDDYGDFLDAQVGIRILEGWREALGEEPEYELLMEYLSDRQKKLRKDLVGR